MAAFPRTIPSIPPNTPPHAVRRTSESRLFRTTCHDHIVWSTRQTQHQRATTGVARRHIPASRSRNRRHLPEVRCLSTVSGVPIVDTLVYLTNAFRSQGFSPSQRLDPDTPSWLYYEPHPPLGLMGLQSFSRRGQPRCLSAPPCSPAIGHSRTSRTSRLRLRVSSHASGKPDSQYSTHRRRPWLQSFAPTGRPTLHTTG